MIPSSFPAAQGPSRYTFRDEGRSPSPPCDVGNAILRSAEERSMHSARSLSGRVDIVEEGSCLYDCFKAIIDAIASFFTVLFPCCAFSLEEDESSLAGNLPSPLSRNSSSAADIDEDGLLGEAARRGVVVEHHEAQPPRLFRPGDSIQSTGLPLPQQSSSSNSAPNLPESSGFTPDREARGTSSAEQALPTTSPSAAAGTTTSYPSSSALAPDGAPVVGAEPLDSAQRSESNTQSVSARRSLVPRVVVSAAAAAAAAAIRDGHPQSPTSSSDGGSGTALGSAEPSPR